MINFTVFSAWDRDRQGRYKYHAGEDLYRAVAEFASTLGSRLVSIIGTREDHVVVWFRT